METIDRRHHYLTGHSVFEHWSTMKAIRLHARGGPEQLAYEDAPIPTPGHGEVRIRVCAAGLTATELTWDETYRHPDGSPRLPSIPGHDVSGVVDALGPGPIDLLKGEDVYGLIDFPFDGSAAEYVVAPAATLAPKPRTLDHDQAAAVPLSALTAWQALFDHGGVKRGSRVLIHGAAGGVGAYAVQLAKSVGAEVIGVASARHAPFAKEIGVDTFIDYGTTRFEDVARDVDFVLDTIGGETRERSWQALKAGGVLIALSAPIAETPKRHEDVKSLFFIVRPRRLQLVEIGKLIDARKLRTSIEAVYPLADAQQAFARGAAGHLSGKLVLHVSSK